MHDTAVFTGDIIRSSDMEGGALDAMFDALQAQCAAIGDWPDSATLFARYRGDGWQMLLPARFALRAALVLRACARATGKGHDTRIGIGLGAARVRDGDLASGEGAAFVASGRALDLIRRGPALLAPDAPAVLRAALPLADHAVRGWTVKQAQLATALLAPDPPTHAALAQTLGQSRQSIQQQAEAAGLPALNDSCLICEAPPRKATQNSN